MSRKPAVAELGLYPSDNELTGRFAELLNEIAQIGPAAAGRRYGVNRGLLSYMVRTKKEPVDVEIRRKLGLPVLAAPCPQCGKVHCCPLDVAP